MALATSSLPVPDSPVMSTVERVGAARATISSTRCMAKLLDKPPTTATFSGCRAKLGDREAGLAGA